MHENPDTSTSHAYCADRQIVASHDGPLCDRSPDGSVARVHDQMGSGGTLDLEALERFTAGDGRAGYVLYDESGSGNL